MNLAECDKGSASVLSGETHFSFFSLETNLIASSSKHSPTPVVAPYIM
jgi:hypothetical protein